MNLKSIISFIKEALQIAVPFLLGTNLIENKAKEKSNALIKKTKQAIDKANNGDGSK